LPGAMYNFTQFSGTSCGYAD